MEWIPWDDMLATGHADIDADHKILIALFNQLTDSVRKRSGKAVTGDLLDDIIEHAKTHFAMEDRLMADHRYPKADQHAAEHVQLIKRAINFKAKFDVGSPGSHIEVIHFPEDWLTFHILGADKELGEFLAAAG
jgi:hemerythrin-like metal-binding protein